MFRTAVLAHRSKRHISTYCFSKNEMAIVAPNVYLKKHLAHVRKKLLKKVNDRCVDKTKSNIFL